MALIDTRSPLPEVLYIDYGARDKDMRELPRLPFASKIRELRLGSSYVTNRCLKYIAQLTNLETLRFSVMGNLTDDGLAEIRHLSNLKHLVLGRFTVNGPGLLHLKHLSRLEALEINAYEQLNGSLECLAELSQLRRLCLSFNTFAPGVLKSLGLVRQIEHLGLTNCSALDVAETESLANMSNLRSLDLHCSQLVPTILKYVASLSTLERLSFTMTNIADSDIPQLGALTNMKHLMMPGVRDDAVLLPFESMTDLEYLHIEAWRITPEVKSRLLSAAPKLQEISLQVMDYSP